MESEQQNESEQNWWQDEEVVQSNSQELDEEEAAVLAANATKDDAQRQEQKQQADKDAKRGRRLAPQEELALLHAFPVILGRERPCDHDAQNRALSQVLCCLVVVFLICQGFAGSMPLFALCRATLLWSRRSETLQPTQNIAAFAPV